MFIVLVGGGLGLALAWLFVQSGDPTGGMLPIFLLPARDVLLGVGLMVTMGVLAGVMPAWPRCGCGSPTRSGEHEALTGRRSIARTFVDVRFY